MESDRGKRMCDVCQDILLIEWHQLALDGTHEVEYRAARCLCGVKLLTAVVKELSLDG